MADDATILDATPLLSWTEQNSNHSSKFKVAIYSSDWSALVQQSPELTNVTNWTAAFLANPNMGHRFRFTQGLSHVEEIFDEPEHHAGIVLPRALEWVAANREDPFFLWVHVLEPHIPYGAPGDAATES